MPIVNKSAIVPFTAEQMFQLVDEIQLYPEFLPWCKKTEIHERSIDEVRASLTLTFSGFEKTFTTCNRLQHNKMIEVRLVEGPFKQLEGFWRFESLGDEGCKIIFDLEFEFSNRLFSMMLDGVFSQVTNSLIEAFCKRAQEKYGTTDV